VGTPILNAVNAHDGCRPGGLRRRQGECGAVTLIQRFGSALNLNVHFHTLRKA
jgi:Putative transposase